MKSIALAAASLVTFLTASSAFAQAAPATPLNRPPSSGPLPSELPPGAETLPGLPSDPPEPAKAANVAPEEPAAPAAITDLPLAEKPVVPPPHFGQKGQLVISSAMSLGVSSSAYSNSEASSLRVTFNPAIDYFVDDNVSIGFDLDLGYTDQKGYSAGSLVESTDTSYGAGARLAFNIPLGTSFSLWTRATLGYSAATQTVPMPGAGSIDVKSDGIWLTLYAPLLVHPAPHYFLGFGPGVYHDLGRSVEGARTSNDRTTIYASFVVGGYF